MEGSPSAIEYGLAAEGLVPLDQPPPLRDRVYDRLEALITSGALPRGSRLAEVDLASRLGVSRGPIREALQRLATEGFVDLRPRLGAFVHEPAVREVEDFYDIRGALEIESARLAAMRVTPETSARMRAAIASAREMLDRGEDPSAVSRQVKIHEIIADSSGSELLPQILTTLNRKSRWYMAPFTPTVRRQEWYEHERIVEAIAVGDAVTAAATMATHNENSRRNYLAMRERHPAGNVIQSG
jgi:DNA-binding GntR family transcriptional regulator